MCGVSLQAALLYVFREFLPLLDILDRKVKSSSGGRRIDLLKAIRKKPKHIAGLPFSESKPLLLELRLCLHV